MYVFFPDRSAILALPALKSPTRKSTWPKRSSHSTIGRPKSWWALDTIRRPSTCGRSAAFSASCSADEFYSKLRVQCSSWNWSPNCSALHHWRTCDMLARVPARICCDELRSCHHCTHCIHLVRMRRLRQCICCARCWCSTRWVNFIHTWCDVTDHNYLRLFCEMCNHLIIIIIITYLISTHRTSAFPSSTLWLIHTLTKVACAIIRACANVVLRPQGECVNTQRTSNQRPANRLTIYGNESSPRYTKSKVGFRVD